MDPRRMAPVKFETDDTVVMLANQKAKRRRCGRSIRGPMEQIELKMGVITTTFSDEEESDSDDEDNTDRLTSGSVRVEWFPSGKEEIVSTDKLSLLDRSLLVGELVAKRSDLATVGYVKNCHITSDVVVLPEKKFAVTGIPADRLRFLKEFDDTATTVMLLFDNWVGNLEESHYRLLLEFDNQYRFWMPSSQITDLTDCTWKRDSYSNFDAQQFYEGQIVKAPMVIMKRVEWVTSRPTGKLSKSINSSSLKVVRFKVLQVELESITVDWRYSLTTNSDFPNSQIKKEELERVKKLDFFENQYLQIGDRCFFTAEQSDCIITYEDWKENFLNKCRQLTNPSGKEAPAITGAIKRSVSHEKEIPSANSPSDTCASPKKRKLRHSVSESNPNDSVFEQQEVEEDVASPSLETCVVRPTRRHIGVTVRKGNRRIGSVNASPIVKTLSGKICRPSGTPKKNSSKLTSSSDSGKGEIQIPEILKSTQPEETSPASSKSAESPYSKKKLAEQFPVAKNICVESILVEAKLEVVWADGSESTERAVDLAFASFDLDNHSFLPGSFVEFKNVDGAASESQLVGIDKYGIIQKMDGKERVGTVNWFQKELSSDAPPKLVSTELHSVYDLVLHSHFHFYTGQVVFSIEENPEKSRVGQVLMVNPSGTVLVRWWYGEMEEVYPQAIFPCDPGDEEYPTFGGNPVEAEPQEDIFMEEENEETLAKGHADSADSDSSWETETEDSDAENENLSDKEETVESNRSAREMRLMQLKAKWKFESRRKEIEQKFANMTSMIDQIERGLEVREPTDLLLPKARACGQQLKSICLDFKEFGLWDEVANILSFLETFENRYGPTGQSDTTSSSVHSTAPGFSVLTESTSAVQEERVMETTSSDPEIEAEADVTTTQDVGSIEVLPAVPANNDFFSRSKALENPPKRFMTAVKDELKRLHRGLPPGIFVKAFEDRMDLFSVMMIGPRDTPFEGGLFIFDVKLKDSYPNEPPMVHFRSFSVEQLNPNLYLDGKVCVSLLGTWTGKSSEMWNAGSNLQQVFVSIQGLILNSEPYFNEAGYETKKVLVESVEKSRRYNEMALLQNIISLTRIAKQMPEPFEKECDHHFRTAMSEYLQKVETWINNDMPAGFPLQPLSQGFKLACARVVFNLKEALVPFA